MKVAGSEDRSVNHKAYTPPSSLVGFFSSDKFVNLVVGPVGCLHGDTLVITEEGAIPISRIDRPMRVLSWNAKTGRFQLSLSGGSFPKGKDYLYRVSTPQGEFDAAGSHLLLCADGEYRKVLELRAGDALAACSHDPVRYGLGEYPAEFPVDVPDYSRTDADCLGGYAALVRRCGQPFLREEGTDQDSAPGRGGVQRSSQFSCSRRSWRMGALLALLPLHTRCGLCAVPHYTTRYVPPAAPHSSAAGAHVGSISCERGASLFPAQKLSQWMFSVRQRARVLARLAASWLFPSPSPSYGVSDRTVIKITRKQVKEAYWDIQVAETENYVTADGAIHHNSTKTTAGILKIAYEAQRVAPFKDGIRRSRAIWIRQTREQLRDTSIPDFLQWFPDGEAGLYMKSENKFLLKFNDVECETLFRPLEDEKDVRKLLSLQATFGIADEFRELNPEVFQAMQGRLGRYPSKADNGVGACDDHGNQIDKFWGMSNPPDYGTWWEEYLTNPPENAAVFFQPSGMSAEADWLQYLKDGYYDNLAEGKPENWIDVYIHAKFGSSLSGQPVHRSFNRDIHVAKSPLQPNRLSPNPLLIGMDIALNPAVVIGQMDFNGRLVVLDCLHAQGMGVLRFCREKLRPLLANKYAGMQSLIIVDPSGVRRMDTDESTVVSLLRAEKFAVKMAMTNRLAPRLAAVDNYLTRMVDGKSAILIDPGADMLIKALAGKYRYRIKKSGEEEDEPDKTHPWSDIADALQYLCLHADGGQIYGGGQHSTARQEVKPAPFKWAV